MKIVSVLLKYDYGIESRGESLEKAGFLTALYENANEVIPFWLEENGLHTNKQVLQEKIIDFVGANNPDVVFFVLMRDEVTIDTIEKLSEKYITINWFCDDQWRFDSFTKYVAPKLSYSVTTDKYSLSKYKDIGYKNVILSQWAAYDYVKNIDFNKIDYKYDISFVGGKNPTREWIIKSLRKKGYNINCFGSGWENGRVSFEEIKDIFLHSKINLNLSNSVPNDIRYVFSNLRNIKSYLRSTKRVEQLKARNFEIACFGGFQLTNYVLELEDYFDIGKDIAIYTNIEELEAQIKYYLEYEDKRMSMTVSAHKKADKYIYKEKLKMILTRVIENEKSSHICF